MIEIRKLTKSNREIKKSIIMNDRFFNVDPARLALATLLVKGRILLHETTGPSPQISYNITKQKSPVKDSFVWQAELTRNLIQITYPELSIAK